MKTTAIVLATVLTAGASLATAQTMVEDADGNGTFSMDELKVAYPDLTEELFVQIDANADGAVDIDELMAARDAGLIAS